MNYAKEIKLEDKEIMVYAEYFINPPEVHNKKCTGIYIIARGDFLHHTIEGICKALKLIQEQNPHIDEVLLKKEER